MNQCDGCRRGLPVVDGMHDLTGTVGSYPGEKMYCTAERYKDIRAFGMLCLWTIAWSILLLGEMGCATKSPAAVTVTWNRTNTDDLQRICAKHHGAAAIVVGRYRGCTIFNRDAGTCTVWAPDFKDPQKDRELMASLGHELKHCFDGPWH